jgi:hypothetical protein
MTRRLRGVGGARYEAAVEGDERAAQSESGPEDAEGGDGPLIFGDGLAGAGPGSFSWDKQGTTRVKPMQMEIERGGMREKAVTR